eukprot:TCALIF_10349-PA protein Name:"Protein of unknown function" AED:0.08 eAED:0.05 QI:109/1/0.5/1/1/1/4/0/419
MVFVVFSLMALISILQYDVPGNNVDLDQVKEALIDGIFLKDKSGYKCQEVIEIGSLIDKFESVGNPCVEKFKRIFQVEVLHGKLKVTDSFKHIVQIWLGGKRDLYQQFLDQTILRITNRFTHLTTVFNPLRAARPLPKYDVDPLVYAKQIINRTKTGCNFCDFEHLTVREHFGSLETKLVALASNAFKLSDYHALIIPKNHNVLALTKQTINESLSLAQEWFGRVHLDVPDQTHPHLLFDAMPHAGASQVHPHFHAFLGKRGYLGQFNLLAAASKGYEVQFPSHSFILDLIQSHFDLNLGVQVGSAYMIASMDAHKDHEILIVGPNFGPDFVEAFHTVYLAFRDVLGIYCFSSALVGPPLVASTESASLPAMLKIGARGNCQSSVNDVSSLELYMLYNVNTDPYQTIRAVRQIRNRQVV